jgi:hypothetical protein
VFETKKRVRRYHSLPASITASVNITPVLARAFVSVFLSAAGPALRPALVPFITPFSLLPTNAVSTFSPSLSPSPIRSLPSLICSDLAAKYAEFECDYSLAASSILPADTVLSLSPDGNGKDFYILPVAASESSLMPPIIDLWSFANVSAIRLVKKDSSFNDY